MESHILAENQRKQAWNGGAEEWQTSYFRIAYIACMRFYHLKLRLMVTNFTGSQDMKKGSTLRENSSGKVFGTYCLFICMIELEKILSSVSH